MVELKFADERLAALYDAFHPPARRADFAFYLPLVMSASAVLDVGCGTGALLGMARDAGHAGVLCGLDPARGMLDRARRRSDVEWVEGDLSWIGRERVFDLVVMTGHAFQELVQDAAIRAVLADGGRVAFETRNPRDRAWERWATASRVRRPTPPAPSSAACTGSRRRSSGTSCAARARSPAPGGINPS